MQVSTLFWSPNICGGGINKFWATLELVCFDFY